MQYYLQLQFSSEQMLFIIDEIVWVFSSNSDDASFTDVTSSVNWQSVHHTWQPFSYVSLDRKQAGGL